jgi:hypothetical protein
MLVQPGHEKYVHHMVIYGCRSNMSQYLNKPQACFDSESGFSAMKDCTDILSAWAMGGEVLYSSYLSSHLIVNHSGVRLS